MRKVYQTYYMYDENKHTIEKVKIIQCYPPYDNRLEYDIHYPDGHISYHIPFRIIEKNGGRTYADAVKQYKFRLWNKIDYLKNQIEETQNKIKSLDK